MSIADKLSTIAENEQKVYDAGYAKGKAEGGNNSGSSKYLSMIDRTITEITAEELEDVTEIGDFAFAGCKSLTGITIPSNITSIPLRMCSNCSGLTKIDIQSHISEVGKYAFYECRNVTEIKFDIPNHPDFAVGSYTFYACGRNTDGINFIVGKNVKRVPKYLLKSSSATGTQNPKITTITFEEGSVCTDVGNYAFDTASKEISKVYYNNSVEDWCNIEFEDTYAHPFYNASYTEFDTEMYIKDELLTDLVIPSTVTKLSAVAFRYCKSITSLSFDTDSQLTTIGKYVFQGCNKLTNARIPSSVTSIGAGLFNSCTALESITFEGTLISSWSGMFYNCKALTNLNVTSIKIVDNNFSVTYSSNLTVESLLNILNAFEDNTGGTTYTAKLGATNLAKLTEEQIAIATNKNIALS